MTAWGKLVCYPGLPHLLTSASSSLRAFATTSGGTCFGADMAWPNCSFNWGPRSLAEGLSAACASRQAKREQRSAAVMQVQGSFWPAAART